MKQILLSLIISFPVVTYTMENPTTPAPTSTPAPSSMISPEKFIEYMNNACSFAHHHSRVQFCTYSLWWAIQEGNNQVFDSALHYWNHYKKHSLEDFTRTELACPFVTAASKGYWYGAQKLLERSKGAIINDGCQVAVHKKAFLNPISESCEAVESSALAAAVKNGHTQVVANLLAYQSGTPLNPELANKNKKTPLMEAIEHDKLACTQALLQGKIKKVNPNAPWLDKSFGSVLHWALSLKDRNQHVKALLEHGADKNLIRKEKEYQQEGTPLMVAVSYANEEGVKLLLESQVNVDLKHPLSKLTAKELAEMKASIEPTSTRQNIFKMLIQAESGNITTLGA